VIRHAEKPVNPAADDPHRRDLTARGYERAKAIPSLFVDGGRFLRPDVIFATLGSKNSDREVETATPLAAALGLTLNIAYKEEEYPKLDKEVLSGKYAGKVVLICWHHGTIPPLAAGLGVQDPPKWPDLQFDRVWKIEWKNGKAVMTDLPEKLMPGDSQ